MANPNISELITTTLKNYSGSLADNVSKSTLFLYKMRQRGNVERVSGGTVISRELEYAEGNFQRYSGYQALNTAAVDVITAAEVDWKQAASTVSVSGREERINSGRERIIPFVKSKIKNAMKTMMNNIAVDLLSDGTSDGGLQIGGLALWLPDDPTTSSTVAGINQSTWSFWRNKVTDFSTDLSIATVDKSNIKRGMNTLYLKCSRGMDKPDLIYFADDYYPIFEESLQDLQRYQSAETAKAGFDTLRYKSADVMADPGPGVTASRAYFINTDYCKFVVHRDADFVALEDRISVNQDATLVPIIFMGNLIMTNRALQGVLKP